MNKLAFKFSPSANSNDHQVRILIDGEDWLGTDYLGVDPPRFFTQPALTAGGGLLVGRCECGCEGCDDVQVQVVRERGQILWTNSTGLRLSFDAQAYDDQIASARNDFSWEDANRTAERLITAYYSNTAIDEGFTFDWASARVHKGMITLSFVKSGAQKLLEFAWDETSPEDAVVRADNFYRQVVAPRAAW